MSIELEMSIFHKITHLKNQRFVLKFKFQRKASKFAVFILVFQKTRTVRVRVPYPYCMGAARTKNHLCGRTRTNRDPLKIPLLLI